MITYQTQPLTHPALGLHPAGARRGRLYITRIMQTYPYAKPHPAALMRGRPSRASGTRPASLGAVARLRRSPARTALRAVRRARATPNLRGLRRSGLDVGGGFPRGVIAALWYEKVSPVHPFPRAPTATPSAPLRGLPHARPSVVCETMLNYAYATPTSNRFNSCFVDSLTSTPA